MVFNRSMSDNKSLQVSKTLLRFGFFLCLMAYQLCRLFNAKAIPLEEQEWYSLTHSWEDKGVHTFPRGICPKVNVIVRLEYELAYYHSAVHRFNHYTTRTPPRTLFSILTYLNKGLLWMVSTSPLISKSSNPFINHLVIVLSEPITIGVTITFMFHHIYPTPPLGQDMTQGQFFKRSLTGLNSEFSFS